MMDKLSPQSIGEIVFTIETGLGSLLEGDLHALDIFLDDESVIFRNSRVEGLTAEGFIESLSLRTWPATVFRLRCQPSRLSAQVVVMDVEYAGDQGESRAWSMALVELADHWVLRHVHLDSGGQTGRSFQGQGWGA